MLCFTQFLKFWYHFAQQTKTFCKPHLGMAAIRGMLAVRTTVRSVGRYIDTFNVAKGFRLLCKLIHFFCMCPL